MPDHPHEPLIDIGANLAHESFSADLEQVLEDAAKVGVETILVTGTTVEGSREALSLARRYPGRLFSTAGIHPHDASHYSPQTLSTLREIAAAPEVRALGETGLDFNRNYSPREAQLEAFAGQLELATELGLPVFLHQRDAHPDFIAILREYRSRLVDVVVHCFTGTETELEDYLALDTYIGLTGWICDERRGHHLHDIIEHIPRDRLLLETDAPYLLPRTIRPRPKSRRNEPRYLPWVVQTVADNLDLGYAEVAALGTRNARRFFRLPEQIGG